MENMNFFLSDFWGKARLDSATGALLAWLPLTDHCLDVAVTFRTLVALPVIRRRLEAAAGRSLTEIDLDRLAVFALLHDVGKPNRGFQEKILSTDAPRAGHIRELAPLFAEDALCQRFAAALEIDTLAAWFADPNECEALLIAAISHHGSPVIFNSSERTGPYHRAKTQWWQPQNGRDPFTGIAALLTMAQQALPGAFVTGVQPLPAPPALQHRFAGLVMLADWLGSHEGFFPFDRDTGDRVTFASVAAAQALQAVGLDTRAAQTDLVKHPPDLAEVFGFAPQPLRR